jgi:hypothetical protein
MSRDSTLERRTGVGSKQHQTRKPGNDIRSSVPTIALRTPTEPQFALPKSEFSTRNSYLSATHQTTRHVLRLCQIVITEFYLPHEHATKGMSENSLIATGLAQ